MLELTTVSAKSQMLRCKRETQNNKKVSYSVTQRFVLENKWSIFFDYVSILPKNS